jgi:hypothetical protein
MTIASIVAESMFFADPGNGKRVRARVRVFMPRRSKGYFVCRVQMHGIAPAVAAGGEDTMQALALGVRFVNNTLARRHSQGWRFFLTKDGGKPFAFWRVWGHSPRLSSFHIPGDLQPIARRLTNRSSGRVRDKVPSSNVGVRAAQLNR